jgi:FKBP-type peptidyl-prolyl cis-trans isomerase
MRSLSCRFGLFFLLLLAAPALRAQREKLPPDDLEYVEKTWPAAQITNTGIRYIIQREGEGAPPAPGDLVSVLYSGRLLNGTTFDASSDPTRPFVFRVGREVVIQGWDYVMQQMKRGERRLIIVPPELGYGTRGQPPRVPRNATLVFVIELLDIKRE